MSGSRDAGSAVGSGTLGSGSAARAADAECLRLRTALEETTAELDAVRRQSTDLISVVASLRRNLRKFQADNEELKRRLAVAEHCAVSQTLREAGEELTQL